MRHWRLGALGFIVSLAAIYFVVSELDLALLRESVASARFVYALPCVALLMLGLAARAFRWRLLLGDGLPLLRTFHIMNVAYLVNGVLPLRMGEVARVYLAWRADPPVPMLKTTSTIILERLLDLLAVGLMIAFALAAGPVPAEIQAAGMFFGVAGLVGFIALVIVARQRTLLHHIMQFLMERVPLLKRLQLITLADHFLDGLMPLARLNLLMQALSWTAISWALSISAGYVLMYTFYEQASWAATCLYIAAAALAIAVPATVASLGVYEASIVVALGAFGYGEPQTIAIAFAVLVHAVNVVVHTVTGGVGLMVEGISLQQLSREAREMVEVGAS